jgi:hypothetical protein
MAINDDNPFVFPPPEWEVESAEPDPVGWDEFRREMDSPAPVPLEDWETDRRDAEPPASMPSEPLSIDDELDAAFGLKPEPPDDLGAALGFAPREPDLDEELDPGPAIGLAPGQAPTALNDELFTPAPAFDLADDIRPPETLLPREAATPPEVLEPIPEDPAELERMRIDAFEGLGIEDQAEVIERDRADRAEHARKLREQALEADRRLQQENMRRRGEARAEADRRTEELVARSQELATKQDPDRWWNSRSTGQKIGAYIAAAIGGWLSAGRGKNEALQMIMAEIDRDIEAQRFDIGLEREGIATERAAVGDQFARAREQFQEREAARLASLQMVDQRLALEQAKYRPDGARALRIAAVRAEARRARAEMIFKASEGHFDREMQIRDQAEKQRAAKARESATWAQLREQKEGRLAAERIAEDQRKTEEARQERLPPLTGIRLKSGEKATTGNETVDIEIGERHASGAMLDNALRQLEDHIRMNSDAQGIINWSRLEWAQNKERTRTLQNTLKLAAMQAVGSKTISERTLPAIEKLYGGDLTERTVTAPVPEIRAQRQALLSNHSRYVQSKLGKGAVVKFDTLDESVLSDQLREQHERGGLPLPDGLKPLRPDRPRTEADVAAEQRRRDFPFAPVPPIDPD